MGVADERDLQQCDIEFDANQIACCEVKLSRALAALNMLFVSLMIRLGASNG